MLPPKMMDRVIRLQKEIIATKGKEYFDTIIKGKIDKIELASLLAKMNHVKKEDNKPVEEPIEDN